MDYCKTKGGKLAEPKSAQANEDIVALAKSIDDTVWIGIDDKSKEGHFIYASDGTSVEYTNWYSGQPDSTDAWFYDEDCVDLVNGYGFEWNDDDCEKTLSFICERMLFVGCQCNEWGSQNITYHDDQSCTCHCDCKVEGTLCDQCKVGYFGLSSGVYECHGNVW